MNMTHVQRRSGVFVSAVVLLLQISSVVAGGAQASGAGQGSPTPGYRAQGAGGGTHTNRSPVSITFTKWITEVVPPDPAKALPTRFLMAGFTGGDIRGEFVGEVLNRQVSLNGRIILLEAMYEVQAGGRSFTALIRGGTGETKTGEAASVSGAALLDGVVLTGWRTGEKVHVAFRTTTNCPGAPSLGTCFQGTITVSPADE